MEKDYNVSYIASLVKKDYRTLDLYEIADVCEAIGTEAIDAETDAKMMKEMSKSKYAEVKIDLRKECSVTGEKVTESYLEDLTRNSQKWKSYLVDWKESEKVAQKKKLKVEKWDRYFQACVMKTSRDNKNKM